MQLNKKQRGISLIEALVALLIFAFGLLGLAGVQLRAMTEVRTSSARGMAIRLIDDINERMQLNRDGVRDNRYQLAWGVTPASVDCNANICDYKQQASHDLSEWKTNVTSQLQNGNARIFQSASDPLLIGVMIAWTANEGKANSKDSVSAAYTSPLKVEDRASNVSCPNKAICHLVYLKPWGI